MHCHDEHPADARAVDLHPAGGPFPHLSSSHHPPPFVEDIVPGHRLFTPNGFAQQDTQSFGETIDLLLELRPKEILLSDSSRRRPLSQKISSLGANPAARNSCMAIYVSRNYFDQVRQ